MTLSSDLGGFADVSLLGELEKRRCYLGNRSVTVDETPNSVVSVELTFDIRALDR
jgi:hypothetical protein